VIDALYPSYHPHLADPKNSLQICGMKKSSQPTNQKKWFTLIEEYLSKDTRQKPYCQAKGINIATFSYWLKKYRSTLSHEKDTTATGFIPIRPIPIKESYVGEEITLRIGAVQISVPARYDMEILIPLIKALA
jgi:hypothetical protein